MGDHGYAGDKTPREAWEMLSEVPNCALVDVRTCAEWAFVGVPDLKSLDKEPCLAEWLEFPQMTNNSNFVTAVQQHVSERDAPVLFICRSGQRSIAAAIAATNAGYKRCYNVLEGFEGDKNTDGHRGMTGGWKVSRLPWIQK